MWQRKILASVFHGGLLLSPLMLTLVARQRWIPSRMMAAAYLMLGTGLAAAAGAPNATTFTLALACSVPVFNAVSPLITASWQRFVPTSHRGRSFGRMALVMSGSGLATSLLLALYLEMISLADGWRAIIGLMAVAAFWVAAATWRQLNSACIMRALTLGLPAPSLAAPPVRLLFCCLDADWLCQSGDHPATSGLAS